MLSTLKVDCLSKTYSERRFLEAGGVFRDGCDLDGIKAIGRQVFLAWRFKMLGCPTGHVSSQAKKTYPERGSNGETSDVQNSSHTHTVHSNLLSFLDPTNSVKTNDY